MNILVIGNGGREQALANSFAKSTQTDKLYVAPGNAGIALKHKCVPISDLNSVIEFCYEKAIDLVFIGPEQPIAEGWSDALREKGIKVIAPSKAAARLETSKGFAKELMAENGVPTARFGLINNVTELSRATEEFSYPIVLKADGLAAGKGVIIAEDHAAAEKAFIKLHENQQGVVAEEFLSGWEVSLFAVTDGYGFKTTIFAQDHKQLYDNDLGPNTGGMGAFAPVPEAETYRVEIEKKIIEPMLSAMRQRGCPYQGILYIGLMITAQGPKVVEFNCRLGDPEAQVILPLLETDLVEICQAILKCEVEKLQVKFNSDTALGVVLASAGYPGNYAKGLPISWEHSDLDHLIFSGVKKTDSGLVTSGGRVLCVIGKGNDVFEARSEAYACLKRTDFEGKTYRSDIGLRNNHI